MMRTQLEFSGREGGSRAVWTKSNLVPGNRTWCGGGGQGHTTGFSFVSSRVRVFLVRKLYCNVRVSFPFDSSRTRGAWVEFVGVY